MKIDPDAAGLDEARLARIDTHLRTRYVEPGKLAGCQVGVARHGTVAHLASIGSMDLERDKPVADDTIWRIYSMTKPVTGVALMTLYEHGMFQLGDPIHRFIPEFRDVRVREGDHLVPPQRPISVRDVMMHMAGLGYGPGNADLDPAILGSGSWLERFESLEAMCQEVAQAPLRFHPGTHWLYSLGTDICARLVEVMSGKRFDHYLQETLFDPLGMVDTGFTVPDDKADRFAAGYRRNSRKELKLLDDPERSAYRRERSFLSGGARCCSTAASSTVSASSAARPSSS
jgi:CubicO group peptidase (beta-lactamase class C family)